MPELPIDERAQHLLKMLVEKYIKEGQPVGSKALAESSVLSLSSATVRNVMAELEELGYVVSPHTSAGRVPTAQGYRLFVDSLLTVKPLNKKEINLAKEQLRPELDVAELLTSASTLLANITQLTCVVTLPRRECLRLHYLEFLPLSEKRVLAILVLNDGEVQNQIIPTQRQYTRSELQQAANYLNDSYAGKDLAKIKKSLLAAMRTDREQMDSLMRAVLAATDKVLEDSLTPENYVIAGQNHLLDLATDLSGLERLRTLFAAFNQKRDILELLDKCLHEQEVQIFIGKEAGNALLDECSIITAPYAVENQVLGALAVVGPTRMHYDRVIPVVDMTAKLLGAALNLAALPPNTEQ